MNSEIQESEALVILASVYRTQTWTFSSIFIAVSVGLVGLPLFVLNASLSGESGVSFILRLLVLGTVLTLADTAVYCINKAIYSSMMHREILSRLNVKGKPLLKYLSEISMQLRDAFPILRQYKMGGHAGRVALGRLYKLQIWGSVIPSLIIPGILFTFVWWNHDHFLDFLLGSELLYLISLWLLFRYVSIT